MDFLALVFMVYESDALLMITIYLKAMAVVILGDIKPNKVTTVYFAERGLNLNFLGWILRNRIRGHLLWRLFL